MQDTGFRAFYSVRMRWFRAGILLSFAFVFLAAECRAADTASRAAAEPCSKTGDALDCPAAGPAPVPNSSKDRKAAHHAFDRGLKLEHAGKLDEAFYQFEEASRLVPQNAEYLAASVMTRENLAGTHLERGNQDLLEGRQAEGLAEFRAALNLDPQNEYAQQRVLDAAGPPTARTPARVQVVASADRITAKPLDALHDIHYAGDSRGLLTAVATSYGLTVIFDDSFPTRHIRFDIDQADFATALQAASAVTKSFAVPIEDAVLFAAPDNPENHRLYDRLGMRSFYISGADQAKDLTELVNSLRTLFEFRFVSLNAASSTITVRGPIGALKAATQFLGQLNSPRPEVLLDVQVFEVSHTFAKNIGLHFPDQFNLFNIPASALLALGGGQNVQQLINQLIGSGGINQAGNTTIASLLAQLQGSGQNSVFSQPVATFGGGLTFFGLSLDQLASVLSLNESSARSLQHVTLRASQEKEATFKVGSRYPVLNASFSPIANSTAIAGVLGNQSYTAPFPSVNYEDIGLTLKAKPLVHGNSDVALELSLQIRALGAGDVNGVPIITSREFTGGILLKNGEPAFIAGMITTSDQRSLNGLPLFSRVPGFGVLTSQNSHQEMDDELLILVTPNVVSDSERGEATEIWVSR